MKKSIFSLKPILVIAVVSATVFTSCEKDKPATIEYEQGVFITNEGSFGNNNASVSFYNYTTDEVTNNVFETANGYSVGDVLQSLCIDGENIYLVVNNSNKVEVVTDSNFVSVGVITGFTFPRYMVTNNGMGYISCWGDNSVYVADLSLLEVVDTILVGAGPEKMLIHNNQLFVTNCGGTGKDSTVSVIDLSTLQVTKTIHTGYNPRDIEIDKNGNLWVLCYGIEDWSNPVNSTPSELVLLNSSTLEVISKSTLTGLAHAFALDINKEGNMLYFGGGYSFEGIYELPIEGTTATKLISDMAYGFTIVKERNELFATIATSWTSAGTLKRYNLDGELLGEYTVGIGPNGAVSMKNAPGK